MTNMIRVVIPDMVGSLSNQRIRLLPTPGSFFAYSCDDNRNRVDVGISLDKMLFLSILMIMTICRTSPPLVQKTNFPSSSIPCQVTIWIPIHPHDDNDGDDHDHDHDDNNEDPSDDAQGPTRSLSKQPSLKQPATLASLPQPPPLVRIWNFD